MSTTTETTPRGEEGSAGIRGETHRGPQAARNELWGYLLYLVTFHQIFHLLCWSVNAPAAHPWLSYIFPGNIDGSDMWTKHVYKYDHFPMLMTNVPLLLLWFFQHSILARTGLQQKISASLSREMERVLYVITSTAMTQFLMYAWKPMPHTLWSLDGPLAYALQSLCLFGFAWTALCAVTMTYNDFFGYIEAFTGVPARWVPRNLPLVYQYTRSPLWLGVIICVWAASEMSVGRLLFAVAMTLYSVMAGHKQDRDLLQKYGREYEDYQKRVTFLIPGLRI